MPKDIHEIYSERVELDPTYGGRVRDLQWSTFDGTGTWGMDAAFAAAVNATDVNVAEAA